ncbi:MAG: PAS domain-containing protein [Pelomonas sp.]|nr:PAS domain-containing protein [Roseateles sp.]
METPPAAPPPSGPAVRPPSWLAAWLRGYWAPLTAALLGGSAVLVLYQVRATEFAGAQRERVTVTLEQARHGLAVASMASFRPVLAMAGLVAVDGGLDATRFGKLARRFFAPVPALTGVAAAPGDIVAMSYLDAASADAADVHELNALATRRAALPGLRARDAAQVFAPVTLASGRAVALIYVPVLLQDDTAPAHYWGSLTGVVDLERLLERAGVDTRGRDVEFALFEARPDGRLGTPIAGDAQLAARGALSAIVEVPGARWALAAMPRGGWQALSPWRAPDLVAVAGGVLALTLLAALLARQRLRLEAHNAALRAEVEERDRARAELERSQARLVSVAALGSDWIWEQDAELRFTYIGGVQALPEQLNFRGVMGRQRWDMAGATGPAWDAHRALVERHEPFRDFEYSFTSNRGRRQVTVSGTPLFDAAGRFTGYRGIGRDVTLERQHALALRESRAELMAANNRLQAILDAAVEVAIIATDPQGRITLFNAGAQRLLRYDAAEMIGRSPTLLHLHGELEQRAEELLGLLGRRVRGFEVLSALPERDGLETRVWTLMRRDGYPLAASVTVTRVQSHEGEPIGWLTVARDITAQLQAETQLRDLNTLLETRVSLRTAELGAARDHLQLAQDELRRAERMAALGALVAGVAHELNTPLGNALTTATTLGTRTREFRARIGGDAPLRRSALLAQLEDTATAAQLIERALHAANDLVGQFKQISADQASQRRRRFDLAGVVNDVLALLRPRLRGAPFVIESDIAVARELDSYPGPLEQIVGNLVQNAALHAFPDGRAGRVRIDARELDAAHFELRVEDDGVGMSAEVAARAFEPFFTTKLGAGGTGLGLGIVRTLCIETLGGSLELDSAPGRGTRFTFRLPFDAPRADDGAALAPADAEAAPFRPR